MAREQFILSDSHSKLMNQLMEMCDLKTKTAVLENALVVFGWAVQEVRKGQAIASVDEARKVYRELTTPALLAAADKPRAHLAAE